MDDFSNNIVIFNSGELSLEVNVSPDKDTVLLNREQIANLFQVDRTVIGRHIKNIYKNEELDYESTSAKIAHVPSSRGREYETEYFNLDMILAIGYRVNAKQGVLFRKWASVILREYIEKGVAVNKKRLSQLHTTVNIMKRTDNSLDKQQVLDVIEIYSVALNTLDDYDNQRLRKPGGNVAVYRLEYGECRKFIDDMKTQFESSLFGLEQNCSFHSSISTIYQTFAGVDLYPSLEEKAANLLYLIVKNHSFADGNKRIGTAIFLYFLDKNNMLIVDNKKIIEDDTLVAVVILIAESRPEEKETMISLLLNFMVK